MRKNFDTNNDFSHNYCIRVRMLYSKYVYGRSAHGTDAIQTQFISYSINLSIILALASAFPVLAFRHIYIPSRLAESHLVHSCIQSVRFFYGFRFPLLSVLGERMHYAIFFSSARTVLFWYGSDYYFIYTSYFKAY